MLENEEEINLHHQCRRGYKQWQVSMLRRQLRDSERSMWTRLVFLSFHSHSSDSVDVVIERPIKLKAKQRINWFILPTAPPSAD